MAEANDNIPCGEVQYLKSAIDAIDEGYEHFTPLDIDAIRKLAERLLAMVEAE